MPNLASLNAAALAGGVGLGVAGFAPLLAVVVLGHAKRINATVGKGLAALGVSFVFLMVALAAVWLSSPEDILVVTAGMLIGFLAMWAVLAACALSHKL